MSPELYPGAEPYGSALETTFDTRNRMTPGDAEKRIALAKILSAYGCDLDRPDFSSSYNSGFACRAIIAACLADPSLVSGESVGPHHRCNRLGVLTRIR